MKKKGYVYFDKNGKHYRVRDYLFFIGGVTGLYNLKNWSTKYTHRIAIDIEEGVSKVSFENCTFKFKKENCDIIINNFNCPTMVLESTKFEGSKETKTIELKLDCHEKNIIVNNLDCNNGSLTITGSNVTINNIHDIELSATSNQSIDIQNFISCDDTKKFRLNSNKINLKNVFVETLGEISIITPNLKVDNIELISQNMQIQDYEYRHDNNVIINSHLRKNDNIYIINDMELNRLQAINKFQSCIDRLDKDIYNEIDKQQKEIDKEYYAKIKELQEEIQRLNNLKTKLKVDVREEGLLETVESYCKKKSNKNIK